MPADLRSLREQVFRAHEHIGRAEAVARCRTEDHSRDLSELHHVVLLGLGPLGLLGARFERNDAKQNEIVTLGVHFFFDGAERCEKWPLAQGIFGGNAIGRRPIRVALAPAMMRGIIRRCGSVVSRG